MQSSLKSISHERRDSSVIAPKSLTIHMPLYELDISQVYIADAPGRVLPSLTKASQKIQVVAVSLDKQLVRQASTKRRGFSLDTVTTSHLSWQPGPRDL